MRKRMSKLVRMMWKNHKLLKKIKVLEKSNNEYLSEIHNRNSTIENIIKENNVLKQIIEKNGSRIKIMLPKYSNLPHLQNICDKLGTDTIKISLSEINNEMSNYMKVLLVNELIEKGYIHKLETNEYTILEIHLADDIEG